jgi:cytochrome c oxidase subunit II
MKRILLAVGVLLIAGVAFIAGTVWIVWTFFSPFWGPGPMHGPFTPRIPRDFQTNGERIYFTGTSQTGPPITAQMPGMHRMPETMMSCASCHGTDGRGGRVRMMMTTLTAPDIRYHTLTEEDHGDEHAGHPPYTDETIKLAITQGIDPAGQPLDWVMPRWSMNEEQLNDLVDYLKTLD